VTQVTLLNHIAREIFLLFNSLIWNIPMIKKSQLCLLSLLWAGSLWVGPAQAILLTMDDIPGGSLQNQVDAMPVYKGLSFSATFNWIDLVGGAWNYGAHSGDFGLLNNYGGTGYITRPDLSDFSFDGVWAKKWDTPLDSGGPITLIGDIKGYNNGNQVWSINTGLNGSYQFIAGQTAPIDELRISLGNHFLIDDLAYTKLSEPYPVALFGLGLLGFAVLRRRQK
jgi:hypothetical protein